MRGTLSVLLNGTRPMTGSCVEPICGLLCCNSSTNLLVSLIKRRFGSSVTGICADSSGKPRVRINKTPAVRSDAAPPNWRRELSIFSAVFVAF